jgi:GT2 family glycosyltransferase
MKSLTGGRAKVSVVIVNYNGMGHIDTCLRSVLNQAYEDFEVIFVDNNSSDGSLEWARANFGGLIFVANNSNLGYAGGINSALSHAAGGYIAPLNMDTEVSADWLSTMVRFMDSRPSVGAVTPKILLFDERNRINAKGLNIHVSGLGFCRQLYRADDGSVIPERVTGVSGCSYLIRRELLDRMGGAPADCWANDDVIVSWLLNLMGYEMYCLPEAVIFHKYRLKMSPEKLFRMEKCRQELVLSSLRPLTLLTCSPLFLMMEVMIVCHSLAKGKEYIKAKLRSFASVWQERDKIKKKRVEYRLLRSVSDVGLFRKLNWNLEWSQLTRILR